MTQDLVIIDYGAGNLRSVEKAFAFLGYTPLVTSDPSDVMRARAVVLPGVGAAGQIMRSLQGLELDEAVRSYIASERPFLGVCMGMQVLMDWSEEDRGQACLGVFSGTVERLFGVGRTAVPSPTPNPQPLAPKVPHIGWNAVQRERDHPLWNGIPDLSYFYFVHSYAVQPKDPAVVMGRTDYAGAFVSAIGRDNVFATQFHPEKSGRLGLRIYQNFVQWALGDRPYGL